MWVHLSVALMLAVFATLLTHGSEVTKKIWAELKGPSLRIFPFLSASHRAHWNLFSSFHPGKPVSYISVPNTV